jgi:hypothetical protein
MIMLVALGFSVPEFLEVPEDLKVVGFWCLVVVANILFWIAACRDPGYVNAVDFKE